MARDPIYQRDGAQHGINSKGANFIWGKRWTNP
jgi:hypothetical protein